MALTIEMVRAAREQIRDVIAHTPCLYSAGLSALCGAEIYCKMDQMQRTGSFKERGARYRMMLLTDAEKKNGVIAASAGNHGLGVARHGKLLGIPVTIVMPRFAPLVKINNCRGYGANVVLEGSNYPEARAHALKLMEERGLTYIQGFDDNAIMAGAGTIGLEILEDVPEVDAIVIPIGGGGMLAGIGVVTTALRPSVELVAVEPTGAAKLSSAFQAGGPVEIAVKPTIADGLGVAKIGGLCFTEIQKLIKRVIVIEESPIATAILRFLELEKMVVEGAGAAGLAAMMDPSKYGLEHLAGKKVVLVISGGNIDVTTLGRVIERGLASDGRLARIVADIAERPGTLAAVLEVIAREGGSIKDVRMDEHFGRPDPSFIRVILTIETHNFEHIERLRRVLMGAGVSLAS